MKKLLTLLIMSFLVASSYAQSSVVKNDLRSDLQAKKSTGSLNIQDDESVPFCHTGLELPRECDDCGKNGNWRTIWFDGFGDWIDHWDEDDYFETAEHGTMQPATPDWFEENYLLSEAHPDMATTDTTAWWTLNELMRNNDYDDIVGLLTDFDKELVEMAKTTTFNANPDGINPNSQSLYSWWMGRNNPDWEHPGYGHWWYLALETDSLFRLQYGLDQAILQFDAAWALQNGVDWLYVEARTFGRADDPDYLSGANVTNREFFATSAWFPVARYEFNEKDGFDGNYEGDYVNWETYQVDLNGPNFLDDFPDGDPDNPYQPTLIGEVVQLRFVLASDAEIDNEVGMTQEDAHGIFLDNVVLFRDTNREIIDDGWDNIPGLHPARVPVDDFRSTVYDVTRWHNSTRAGNSGRSLTNGYNYDLLLHYDPTTEYDNHVGNTGIDVPDNVNDGYFPMNSNTPDFVENRWGKPYVYPYLGYARETYEQVYSEEINLRYDSEDFEVHKWHPICLNFDYMMNLEERDGLGANTSDVSLRSDWWRFFITDPQDGDAILYDSGPVRDLGGDYNTQFVEYGEVLIKNDVDDLPLWDFDDNGFPLEDYNVVLHFEFYSNGNIYQDEGVFIDNVHLYHKWDNGENNETFADAYNIEDLFVDMGNYEEFHTTCAMLLPEFGGLYYPDYDEDFYKLYLTKDQFVDIVTDNEEVDLYIAIYDEDGRLIVSDDGTSSNGMPYAVDYDRVIFTIDEDLPNIEEGWYYIFVGASPDVAIDSEGRYRLSIRRGFSDVDVTAVNDVPQDQGLQVRVQWNHSFLDDECIPVNWGNNDDGNPLQLNGIRVEKYTVWRKKGFEPNWDYVNQVIAVPNPIGLDPYGYVAATLVDNTTHYFRVGTHMFNGEINFGAEGNGKSLDNLAPNLALMAEPDLSVPLGIKVDWEVDYDDVETYEVYRSTSPGINPDLLTPIATVAGSVLEISDTDVEAGITYYYVVVGTDKGGNKGISNEDAASVTGVGESLVPDKYSLSNNYPNPFNPSTTIKFGLPVDANVTMKVFDILGQEVTTLISSTMKAGYHTFNFDASKLMSGMYIYRINAEGIDGSNFMDVKKMLLVK